MWTDAWLGRTTPAPVRCLDTERELDRFRALVGELARRPAAAGGPL